MSTVDGGVNIVTDGLVFYVDAANTKSYPGSGTAWNDISKGGNNGTLINGPTFNSANGGSIVFDGVNDYVQYETSLDPYISGNKDFTIELWVYKNISGDGMIFSSWDEIPNRKFYVGYISNSARFVASSTGSDFAIAQAGVLTNNTWHHIVVTRAGVEGNSGVKIYINNILQILSFTGTFSSITTNSVLYRIGNRVESSNPFPLLGKVSLLKIYNRALSSTEILQNYNATRARFGI